MLSNYPDGLSDHTPGAPWNDPDVPEKEFDVTCSQTLSKTVTVTTNDYIPGACGVDYEPDDEGGCCAVGWHDPDDTSDTNWANEYHANDYHTPLQLIQLLKQVLENDLANGIVFKSPRFTQDLINECNDWQEDETEYVEE
jgi:hypothetical protein